MARTSLIAAFGAAGLALVGCLAGCDDGSRVGCRGEQCGAGDAGAETDGIAGEADGGLPDGAAPDGDARPVDAAPPPLDGAPPPPEDAAPPPLDGAPPPPDLGADAAPPADGAPPSDAVPDVGSPADLGADARPPADAAPPPEDQGPPPDASPCENGLPPELEICDGADNDCDGSIDEGFDLGDPCDGIGECGIGFLECDDEGGVRCSTDPGGSIDRTQPELCNGLDDDCDGEIDDGLVAACYDGPPATAGRGTCRMGTRRCAGGREGDCEDQVLPAPDLCNGLDDDCDGQIDEDFVPSAECGEGVCRANAVPSDCFDGVLTPCQPGPSLNDDANCNGLDDDCDGQIDDGYVPESGCGIGRCGALATPSSCEDGVERPCAPAPPAADDRTCDGVDDDCDGLTDEDYAPTLACGFGACRAASTPSSCADGVETFCQPGEPALSDPTCDGVDDDCDGQNDEDYVPIGECGQGVCALDPTPSRCAGGNELPCTPSPPTGDDTDCDGLDDDCDGEADDGYVPDGSCGVGVCAQDTVPSSCAGGQETACQPGPPAADDDANCDHEDDDCDGQIDEDAPVKLGADRRITQADGISRYPWLIAVPDGFALAWGDGRDGPSAIYFARLRADGSFNGAETRISRLAGAHFNPTLAQTDAGYGVAWYSTRDGYGQIYYSAIGADGQKRGDDLRVTHSATNAANPSMDFSGNELGLVWAGERDGNQEIYFRRLSAAGEEVGLEVRVTRTDGGSTVPHIVWNGVGWGVTWAETTAGDQDIWFQRLAPDGTPLGNAVRVTDDPTNSSAPRLVYNGNGYGVTWRDTRDDNTEIYFALLDAQGNEVGDDVRVSNDLRPSSGSSLAFNGQGYGVAWFDLRDGNHEIYFAHISLGGIPSPEIRLTNDPASSFSPSLVWTGEAYGLAWHDTRDGNEEIYFARGPFGCP